MKMININKMINTSVALSAVLGATLTVSCAKWTEPESVDFEEGIEQPSLTYLASLRDYKASSHKVSMFMVDLPSEQPVSRNQHIMAMPDSADFICVRNAVNGIFPAIAEEISEVYMTKGTEVLCEVNYTTIFEQWSAIEDAKENEPAGTEEEYRKFVGEKVAAQIACCDQYGFAGIMVTMENNTLGFHKAGQEVFLSAIENWRNSHSNHTVIVKGNIGGLIDQTIIEYSKYVIIPVGKAYSSGMFSSEVKSAFIGVDKGQDRVIVQVAVPNDENPQKEDYIKEFQPIAAARWVNEPDKKFVRCGIMVSNIQDDYSISSTYNTSRKAISLLNTTAADAE